MKNVGAILIARNLKVGGKYMNYTALYRKFRPKKFEDIVGQEHITRTLRNQIISNRVGHAYLFNGTRGTGKTSAAKILARAVNCLNPKDGEPCNECEICKAALSGALTDIVEMDAASNNSVDDIRIIRDEVNFLPTLAKYRVYIIDEVHMLSTGAFNALLKTLEEPPAHVKFILATTEPQKLPATILSRCQRFDFKKISDENIDKRLQYICDESKIEITKEALKIIAVLSEGAMRDALSILERCLQEGNNQINEELVKELVGIPKLEYISGITESIINYDVDNALKVVNEVLKQGKDISNLIWEIIKYFKDILVYKTSQTLEIYNEKEITQIKGLANNVSKERLLQIIYDLSGIKEIIKNTKHVKVTKWHDYAYDIVPKTGGKAAAIQAVSKHFGYQKEELMAFGDGHNDIEMLDVVGYPIVMGNGSDEVKQHACYICDDVEKEGILKGLKHFNLID